MSATGTFVLAARGRAGRFRGVFPVIVDDGQFQVALGFQSIRAICAAEDSTTLIYIIVLCPGWWRDPRQFGWRATRFVPLGPRRLVSK